MHSIELLINEIRKRPGLYLGKKSISLFRAFIHGYEQCLSESEMTRDVRLHPDLYEFVLEKYPTILSIGWVEIILGQSSSEEEAFDKFFVLYDEFQKRDCTALKKV